MAEVAPDTNTEEDSATDEVKYADPELGLKRAQELRLASMKKTDNAVSLFMSVNMMVEDHLSVSAPDNPFVLEACVDALATATQRSKEAQLTHSQVNNLIHNVLVSQYQQYWAAAEKLPPSSVRDKILEGKQAQAELLMRIKRPDI